MMLPNHAPLVVAEQFALLEALHPGRIDLGIGRAPGTDLHTAALRAPRSLGAEDFATSSTSWACSVTPAPRRGSGTASSPRRWPRRHRRSCCSGRATSAHSWRASSACRSRRAPLRHGRHAGGGRGLPQLLPAVAGARRPAHDRVGHRAGRRHRGAGRLAGGPSLLRRYGMRTGRLLPLLAPDAAAEHPDMAAACTMATRTITGTPSRSWPASKRWPAPPPPTS